VGRIIKSIEILSTPEKIFNSIIDFDKMNQMHQGFTEAICTSKEKPFGIGTTAHFVGKHSGSNMEWDMEVTEYEPNKRIRWQSNKPNMANILTLEPTINGTLLTHETFYELPYSVFGKLIDKVMVNKNVNREIELELEQTKKALEYNNQQLTV
jgi:uncharacterized membrane protein